MHSDPPQTSPAPMPSLQDPTMLPASTSDLEKVETNASALYSTLPLWRKSLIVFVLSWSTLAACFSSTSLLSASTEIAADFHTTPNTINLSTGGLLLAMGLSSFVWSPLSSIFGRKVTYPACIAVLFVCTIGAAVAPNIRVFVAMRVLSGLQGCYFHVAGQTILAEYFPPVSRRRWCGGCAFGC